MRSGLNAFLRIRISLRSASGIRGSASPGSVSPKRASVYGPPQFQLRAWWRSPLYRPELIRLGYGLSATGIFDDATATVLRAFQRRYRPERIDGIADAETASRLDAVLRLHGSVD